MIISPKGKSGGDCSISIDDVEIKECENFKFLGVVLDNELSFAERTDQLKRMYVRE